VKEKEWLACTRVAPALKFLFQKKGLIYKGKKTQQHPRGRRRLRLFAVALARRVEHMVTDRPLRRLLIAAEEYADGIGSLKLLQDLCAKSRIQEYSFFEEDGGPEELADWLADRHARGRCAGQAIAILSERDCESVCCLHANAAFAREGKDYLVEAAIQANLLRDIFDNPFRPVSFSPEWRTSSVVSIAQSMYDSRDFAPMPVLADALQDAGCEHEDILAHCRDANGTHVRGCWVVDLALGKN